MNKRINLFDALKESDVERSGRRDNTAFIVALALILVLNLAAASLLLVQKKQLAARDAELTAQLETQEAQKLEQDYAEAESTYYFLEEDVAALEMLEIYYSTQTSFTAKLYNDVTAIKPSNVNVVSFNFSDGAATIDCTTPDNMPPADYTKALQNSELFTTVEYSGFSTDANGSVIFPIVCVVPAWEVTE